MKIGDLVQVKPSCDGFYIVTSMVAYDPAFSNCRTGPRILEDCVMLVATDGYPIHHAPMLKKWIKVVSS